MKAASWITLIYGIFIFLGGLMGHIKAGSTVSLVSGAVFGVLLVLASFGMFRDHLLPAYFSLILTLLLDAFFTYRWLLTFQFMPSGLMSVITLGVLIVLLVLLRSHLKPGNTT